MSPVPLTLPETSDTFQLTPQFLQPNSWLVSQALSGLSCSHQSSMSLHPFPSSAIFTLAFPLKTAGIFI